MPPRISRNIVIASALGLIVLGLLWELWLAPLRPAQATSAKLFSWLPASWLLSLKIMPLLLALPAFVRGKVKAYQWWSMVILIYLTEGLVRATSDRGLSAQLGWVEVALSCLAFVGILSFVRESRIAQTATHS